MRIVVEIETEDLEEDEVCVMIEEALAEEGIVATAYPGDEDNF